MSIHAAGSEVRAGAPVSGSVRRNLSSAKSPTRSGSPSRAARATGAIEKSTANPFFTTRPVADGGAFVRGRAAPGAAPPALCVARARASANATPAAIPIPAPIQRTNLFGDMETSRCGMEERRDGCGPRRGAAPAVAP